MLNNITWASYWIVLTVITIIYYVYVLQLCYRPDHAWIASNAKTTAEIFQESFTEKTNQHARDRDDNLLPMVVSLRDELKAFLEEASIDKEGKDAIIHSLKKIAGKYKVLKGTQYQTVINQQIQSACETKCAIHLDDGEVLQVWMQ